MIEFYPRDIPILSTCSRCPRGLLVNSPVFSGSGPWFARRCSTVLPHWRPTSSTLGPGGKNHRITNKKWGSRGVKFMDVSDFWALKNNGVPHSVHWSIMSIIIVVISWWPGGVPNFHTQMVPVFQILDGCNMIFRTPAKHGGLRPRPSTVGTHLIAIPRGEDPHPQCRKGCGLVFQSLSFRTSKPSREVSWLLDTTSDRRPWAPPAHSAPGAPRRPTELVSHGLLRPWTL